MKLIKNWCSELVSGIIDVLERNQFIWTWKWSNFKCESYKTLENTNQLVQMQANGLNSCMNIHKLHWN